MGHSWFLFEILTAILILYALIPASFTMEYYCPSTVQAKKQTNYVAVSVQVNYTQLPSPLVGEVNTNFCE
jgi:multidrug resistance efflux pump